MTFDFAKVDNSKPMTVEEGYELTRFYVNYYWITNKFYSLKDIYEEDDVVSELLLKFMKHEHFSKYDPSKTSKKYFIMRAVYTSMVDLLRKQKPVTSLDKKNPETGLFLSDMIVDESAVVDDNAVGSADRLSILSQLPRTSRSRIHGYSPLMKKDVGVDYYTLARHLEAGFTVKDMTSFYVNPDTGAPVSEGSLCKYITALREYVLDNVVIA